MEMPLGIPKARKGEGLQKSKDKTVKQQASKELR
jgi:hypothetical protein